MVELFLFKLINKPTPYNHRVKVDMMRVTCPSTNSKIESFSWAKCGSYEKEPAI